MEKVKKDLDEILNNLEKVQEEVNTVYSEVATSYTSLKGKDINQAYLHMIFLKEFFDEILEKFDDAVDYYESRVISMLEEEENERRK